MTSSLVLKRCHKNKKAYLNDPVSMCICNGPATAFECVTSSVNGRFQAGRTPLVDPKPSLAKGQRMAALGEGQNLPSVTP
ncbi:hypothetical protein R75777_07914 [Paraburkholderia nemoris]|nr:hypothetical protein R75777_07914 [Paraburkholderia nemoris]